MGKTPLTKDGEKKLQEELKIKNKSLEEKNKQANEKLKQMVEDQQVAETEKKNASALKEKILVQNQEIPYVPIHDGYNLLLNLSPFLTLYKSSENTL